MNEIKTENFTVDVATTQEEIVLCKIDFLWIYGCNALPMVKLSEIYKGMEDEEAR